jgi:hypothetical protein
MDVTMNHANRFFLIAAFLFLFALAASPAAAQRSSGYVDLKALGQLDRFFERDATMEINVEGALMRMVAAASRAEDPELADLLSRLDGVYVIGYRLPPHTMDDFDVLSKRMGDSLRRTGWTVIVRYRDDQESTQLFARMKDGKVEGMVVMSVEAGSDQAVFVNIVGDIDPEQIGRIGQKFQIGGMDRM